MGFAAIDKLTRPFLQLHEWDNGAERIVHTTTIQILLCFTVLVSSNMMFGQPITCLMLPETPDSAANYFHDFCFYQDKLRIQNSTIKRALKQGTMRINPIASNSKEEIAVTYYQWTPFIIFIQVALCVLPAMLWKFVGLHYVYGNDFAAIIRGLVSKEEDDKINGDGSDCKTDAREAHRWLELKKRELYGMSTTMTVYVAMKWLTFVTLVLQFYMMAKIYASGELLWGVHISYDLLNGVYKNVFSGVFPQIVGCKTHRTQMGGVVNEFVMRCILPQNFINSKVFLFLYWWYILAMLVALISAVQCTILLLLPRYQRYSTKALLPTQEFFLEEGGRVQHSVVPGDSDTLEYFIDYLGNDGYLLLQCASVPLSVVRMRCFVYALYEIVVVNGGEFDDEGFHLRKTEDLPIEHTEFDGGGDRIACGKDDYSQKKAKLLSDDSFSEPLLGSSSPSSSSSSKRYSPPPSRH